MNVPKKDLQEFNRLWQKQTGKKLTRAEAVEEFHKLIALVKLQAEIVLRKSENHQCRNRNLNVNGEKDFNKKARKSAPKNNDSQYNKRA